MYILRPQEASAGPRRQLQVVAETRPIRNSAHCTSSATILKVDRNGGSIYGTRTTDEEDDPLGPDGFEEFICPTPTTVAENDTRLTPINWWIEESQKGNYDQLYLYALDHSSRSVMAPQCEQVFSVARRTLTPERNTLGLKVLKGAKP
jgi:hypothetical protein